MQSKKCRARMEVDCETDQPEFAEASAAEDTMIEDAMDVDSYFSDDNNTPAIDADPPVQAIPPTHTSSFTRRTTVEDELDEPADINETYIEAYPRPAGTPKARGMARFGAYRQEQVERGEEPWAPFESEAEWELARWLMTSGVSQNKINDFLKLNKVMFSHCCHPSRSGF